MDGLSLVDKAGEPIEGLQAIVAIHRAFPGRLAGAEDRFFAGRITADAYLAEMKAMVEDFKQGRFVRELDRRLGALLGG